MEKGIRHNASALCCVPLIAYQDDAKLPQDDHARIVKRQVDRTIIDQLYTGRGKEPYDTVVLLMIVLYQYLKGRRSPAVWEEAIKQCGG